MWDIVYYLAGVGMLSTIGYGFLWIYDRDMAKMLHNKLVGIL